MNDTHVSPEISFTPQFSAHPARIGHLCAAPECGRLVLHNDRFCNGCVADAAKDCARQLEASLIERWSFDPAGPDIRRLLPYEAAIRPLAWFESASVLGPLSSSEAIYLRNMTEMACRLVAAGGVARLAELPGTRALHADHPSEQVRWGPRADALRAKPTPVKGTCNFSTLPQHTETEPLPARWRQDVMEAERRLQAYWAVTLLVMLALVVLR